MTKNMFIVECNNGGEYEDNVDWTEYVEANSVQEAVSKVAATYPEHGDGCIWRITGPVVWTENTKTYERDVWKS